MVYDDIIIGSGLAALGVAIGLPRGRRVLVIGGPETGEISHYEAGRGVPSAYLGFGGLGRYWHGVIPTSLEPRPDGLAAGDFAELFDHFYPATPVADRIERPWLFVPKRPIRTPAEWMRLHQDRGATLTIAHELALSFSRSADGVAVRTSEGEHSAARLWIAAGTLHTPKLLQASLPGFAGVRGTVSDHIITYIGQIDRDRHPEIAAPRVERAADGYWTPAAFGPSGGLFTLKPARFSYRRLDHGIEQRAAFGLPTGGVIAKVVRAGSLGLIAEALYNKLGLFPEARRLSVYAQLRVPEAYAFDPAPALTARPVAIRAAADTVRADPVWRDALTPSARTDLFINGIHLHNSVDADALLAEGINLPNSSVKVVDASVARDIGAEHHSFKLMAAAYAQAKRS